MTTVTVKVTAPAGRLIPGIGSFQAGETFTLPEDEAEALVAGATGLEIVRSAEVPVYRRSRVDKAEPSEAPQESEG